MKISTSAALMKTLWQNKWNPRRTLPRLSFWTSPPSHQPVARPQARATWRGWDAEGGVFTLMSQLKGSANPRESSSTQCQCIISRAPKDSHVSLLRWFYNLVQDTYSTNCLGTGLRLFYLWIFKYNLSWCYPWNNFIWIHPLNVNILYCIFKQQQKNLLLRFTSWFKI